MISNIFYGLLLPFLLLFTACGDNSSESSSQTVRNLESKPIVYIGDDQIIRLGTTVTITATVLMGDDENLNYVWSDENGTVLATTLSFDYYAKRVGDYILTLTVTDADGLILNDSMKVHVVDEMPRNVSLSGVVTYDLVPFSSNERGLDYDNISQEPCRFVIVDLLDSDDNVLDSTETNAQGEYTFSDIAPYSEVKIRVYAKMYRDGTPSWDFKVVDNTQGYATYVMDGTLESVGDSDSFRYLNASSGWDGTSYTSARVAAPFAILDTVYSAMSTVLTADASINFPPLVLNWSVLNNSASGDITLGQIVTSYYNGDSNIYILGDADVDTDEYDNHVIAHEWGHYYEDKFSRSDSIGGAHNGDDLLDIRVAFGEGWGNAFSAMALKDPIYFDTLGEGQRRNFVIDIESGVTDYPGWFSETSVEKILYDIFDAQDDDNDNISFGFAPIHHVFTGSQKTASAFTSIFTFITALKDENPSYASSIDTLVSGERIATINDIYGTGRTNKQDSYPYHYLDQETQSVVVTTTTRDGYDNKLSNHQYVRFDVESDGNYNIQVVQINKNDDDCNSEADPDFTLYRTTPFAPIEEGIEEGTREVKTISLTKGSYLLDISDYNNISEADLNVTIE